MANGAQNGKEGDESDKEDVAFLLF